MTQSGAGFTTAALFARPLGASQPAKAVSLASKGAKVSRMHAMGVKGVMVACNGAKRVEKAPYTAALAWQTGRKLAVQAAQPVETLLC